MPKEMVSIPEGNLLRIAETKSVPSYSALKEKTGVDRKTLRAINAGQPVKGTTLQSIADKLRIPIEHLLNADKNEVGGNSIRDANQYRDIKLRQLDAAALRKLASEHGDEITWFLQMDRMPIELELVLKELKSNLKGWCLHNNVAPEEENNLDEEISYIKTSAGIEKGVEELVRHKLKIFGGTYITWHRFRPTKDGLALPILGYRSRLRAALSIVPQERNSSTVRVNVGYVPPQKFIESELVEFERVYVDGTPVWSREIISDDVFGYVPSPF
jgi:hypothetical protein